MVEKNGIEDRIIVENIDALIETYNIDYIYLDFDGVLIHSCQAISDVINDKYGTNYKGSDILSWNCSNLISDLTDEEIEQIFTDDNFFKKVKFIDGAVKFMEKYKDKIIIVTKARPNNFVKKVELLKSVGLEDIPMIAIPFHLSKNIIHMFKIESNSIFIDDSTNNLNECMADFRIQFLEYNDGKNNTREWTKDWDGLKMYHW